MFKEHPDALPQDEISPSHIAWYTVGSITQGNAARQNTYGECMNTKWRIIITIFVIGVSAISLYMNP
ncbi:hypothetical protein [Herminiimonas arsenitoxidans]|uniref:hypothetical protein n=1 Tax=Herminiimonas arsenitoxidans TaxID=1809410 RepID=UPI0012FF5C28|nr:hypothetical protein [Herminiimonas arsenitoxidans]